MEVALAFSVEVEQLPNLLQFAVGALGLVLGAYKLVFVHDGVCRIIGHLDLLTDAACDMIALLHTLRPLYDGCTGVLWVLWVLLFLFYVWMEGNVGIVTFGIAPSRPYRSILALGCMPFHNFGLGRNGMRKAGDSHHGSNDQILFHVLGF